MELPECAVCLVPFGGGDGHEPRVLTACGHSVCDGCLRGLAANASGRPATSSGDGGSVLRRVLVRCPECSARTRLPDAGVAGLPKNIELMRLVEALRRLGGGGGTAAEEAALPTSLKGSRDISRPPLVASAAAAEVEASRPPADTLSCGGGSASGTGNDGSDGGCGAADARGEPFDGNRDALQGHVDAVTAIVVAGGYLATASFDKTVRLWSAANGGLLHTLTGHGGRLTALAALEVPTNGSSGHSRRWLLASGDHARGVHVWSLPPLPPLADGGGPQELAAWQEHDDWRFLGVLALEALPHVAGGCTEAPLLYSGSGDHTVKAWSLEDFTLVAVMEGHRGPVSSLAGGSGSSSGGGSSPGNEVLASGGWDGEVRLWWRADHSPLAVLRSVAAAPEAPPVMVGVKVLLRLEDGDDGDELLFVAREDGSIEAWREDCHLASISAHDGQVSALAASSVLLFSCGHDKKLKAWHLVGELFLAQAYVIEMPDLAVTALLHHNGLLCAATTDGTVKVRARALLRGTQFGKKAASLKRLLTDVAKTVSSPAGSTKLLANSHLALVAGFASSASGADAGIKLSTILFSKANRLPSHPTAARKDTR
eukprot:SM000015S01274  [mRNA]  locus=s15:895323:898965:- [translate_table: standard]